MGGKHASLKKVFVDPTNSYVLDETFRHYDADNDGQLDLKEAKLLFHDFLDTIAKFSDEDKLNIKKALETHSKDELFKDVYKDMDRDSDGVITLLEFQAFILDKAYVEFRDPDSRYAFNYPAAWSVVRGEELGYPAILFMGPKMKNKLHSPRKLLEGTDRLAVVYVTDNSTPMELAMMIRDLRHTRKRHETTLLEAKGFTVDVLDAIDSDDELSQDEAISSLKEIELGDFKAIELEHQLLYQVSAKKDVDITATNPPPVVSVSILEIALVVEFECSRKLIISYSEGAKGVTENPRKIYERVKNTLSLTPVLELPWSASKKITFGSYKIKIKTPQSWIWQPTGLQWSDQRHKLTSPLHKDDDSVEEYMLFFCKNGGNGKKLLQYYRNKINEHDGLLLVMENLTKVSGYEAVTLVYEDEGVDIFHWFVMIAKDMCFHFKYVHNIPGSNSHLKVVKALVKRLKITAMATK